MDILFYRYGSICEPDILEAFRELDIHVIEENTEVTQKTIPASTRIELLAKKILTNNINFVFSINYFPHVSDVCDKLHIPYVCWSVDCPVLELFSVSIRNRCNRIFLFDYEQFRRFQPENPKGIFYLPLATNPDRWNMVITDLTDSDREKYSADISFVGSLYTEKSPLSPLNLPAYMHGMIDGIIQAQTKVYGYNFLEELTNDEMVSVIKSADSSYLSIPKPFINIDKYIVSNYYLGMAVSEAERIQTLNALAEDYEVTLYTRSVTNKLQHVICRTGVSTHTEMPKVFHCSKINLNITMKPIQTGLSLRVWDILGCSGFLLSNYQAEIPEYFEIGKDLDCYESLTDLKEKVAFYLTHDDIRMEIANNGYQKVKQFHTYKHRIVSMFETLLKNPLTS